MGFSCGFYSYTPVTVNGEQVSVSQVELITNYYSYFDNDWAKEKFNSAMDYVEYLTSSVDGKCSVTQEMIDSYSDLVHKDEYGCTTISDEIESWCSIGATIDDLLHEITTVNNDCHTIITKDVVYKLMKICSTWISNNSPKNITYHGVFTNEDDNIIKVNTSEVDGIEFYDGESFKRIYFEYDNLYLYTCDEEYYYLYTSLLNACIKMLEELDNGKIVYYNGGW